jgi:hypothetical protein
MNKFKISVGDRVAVYSYFGRIKGVIIDTNDLSSGRYFFVREDGFYSCHKHSPFHDKQCRKLVGRKKK